MKTSNKKTLSIIYGSLSSIFLFIFIVCIAVANQQWFVHTTDTISAIGGIYGTAYSFLAFTLMTLIIWVWHISSITKKIEHTPSIEAPKAN